MSKLEFIILGKNQPILEIVVRLVNANENWNAVGFGDENLAQKHFLENKIDFVLLSSGIDDAVEKEFTHFCVKHNPEVEVIEHFGGGSGLLQSEIYDRLHKKGKL
ncbi:hypothetical protein GON26_00295 [Flavobacterium sp. GA093]|uniref:Response regulator receiver domain-containing protein n=1 Tax=Flavobacterium hydrocarbonoxydans TaxID=2683249 RepID=A0A6I4NNM6_9FLAO|nr:hypothetical protein [Flavobacterium hydrocarbonoxydans]MWB92794.1 hypothetical protein [Flavobacterium hydrocarbonoxydans]